MTVRFLPWVRRGLAAEMDAIDTGADLPTRAQFPVTVTVNGSDAVANVSTYGPGDITGIDTDVIVRAAPRRFATNAAPDEFAAVEFDPPDFPWMFTPAAAGAGQRLRPWLVLVVVAKTDGVSISVSQDSPLPALVIQTPAVPAQELPDLSESWAWAHAQVVTADAGADTATALSADPDHSVSRLVCPRRLRPGARYYAALVPAFDAGVQAGFGLDSPADQLGPAWDHAALGAEIRLPVYYHWEFTTGPAGDFESLARRLRPTPVPDGVGSSPMFIGAAHPALPQLAGEAGVVAMEGALRSPQAGTGRISGPAQEEFATALTRILDTAAEAATGGTPSDAEAVAPPIYGQWPVGVHRVPAPAARPRWLRDLNTEPESRVAAGLGAEVVRANQEEYVDAAWAQVGDVVAANRLLDLARAMTAVTGRIHRKHLVQLDPLAALALTSPAHERLALNTATVRRLVTASALPVGFTSRGFRRLASPREAHLRLSARRSGTALPGPGNAALSGLARAANGDFEPVLRIAPDGVRATVLGTMIDRGQVTIPAALDAQVRTLRVALDPRMGALQDMKPVRISVRADLAESGLVFDRHLDTLRVEGGLLVDLHDQLDTVRKAAPGKIDPGKLQPGKLQPGKLQPGKLQPGKLQPGKLQPGKLQPGKIAPLTEISRDLVGKLTADPPLLGALGVRSFSASLAAAVKNSPVGAVPEPAPRASLDLASMRNQLIEATRPQAMIQRRVRDRIRIGGTGLDTVAAGRIAWTQREPVDPIMVGPVLDRPLYLDLARFDQNRFLPGAGRIPDDAITVLATNPRFVEAFLVGANHEFNRELLWRRYPTDRRGTALRTFWDHLDGSADIEPIHSWPGQGRLGSFSGTDPDGSLVLLVRGQLLRRYPNTVVYATQATADRRIDTAAAPRLPVFSGVLDPDIVFVGFDFGVAEATAGHGTFFVLQEQPTEPRFGLDAEGGVPGTMPAAWSDLSWPQLGVEPGGFLALSSATGNPTRPLAADRPAVRATFGADAASMAAITFQRPFRAAVHSSEVLT